MFSLAYNLNKNDVEFLPVEISSKQVRANNVDFSTIKITSKKVSENNVDFLTREITSKNLRGSKVDVSNSKITPVKVRGNKVDFSTIEITPKKVLRNDVDFCIIEITLKKVCGNDLDFPISEITSKKYAEMTWKFVEIWSSTYRYNIHVESTSIWPGATVRQFFTHWQSNTGCIASFMLFLCVINSILQSLAVSDWIHDVFFNFRCFKVNFADSCSVTGDINHSQSHSDILT